ncbi:MAG: lipoprotein insertase outer membrane protein LolB [Pseudomonadota bacterium]
MGLRHAVDRRGVARHASEPFGRAVRWLSVCALAALLQACATRGVQQLPLLTDWPTRERVMGALDVWSLRGRIGIRTPEDSSSGNLFWVQDRRQFDAQIDGPLGIGGVQLEGDPDRVTLSGSRIETRTVNDPSTELFRQTGLRVPIEGLRYWLLGVPMPDAPADVTMGAEGLPSAIQQSGWTISYKEYRRWTLNELPRRIIAESGDTKLTIVVRDWDIREQA